MDSHFSDDRDILPESDQSITEANVRKASWQGRLLIVAVVLSVVFLSTIGGTITELGVNQRTFKRELSQDFWLCRGLELVVGAWLFSVGASIASFLNVVAWRAPNGMKITGHSFCPNCSTPIASIDNIPILGWLRLQGKCFTCKQPISKKYPAFEAVGGYLFLVAYAVEFLSSAQNIPQVFLSRPPYGLPSSLHHLPAELCWLFAVHLFLVASLLALLMTRIERGVLPPSYWLFIASTIVVVSLMEPSVINASRNSLDYVPPTDLSSLLKHYLLVVVPVVFVALVVALVRTKQQRLRMERQCAHTGCNSEDTEQCMKPRSPHVNSVIQKAFAVGTCVLVLGLVPTALVLLVCYALSRVYKFLCASHNEIGHSHVFVSFQDWLLPVTFLFLMAWCYLAWLANLATENTSLPFGL